MPLQDPSSLRSYPAHENKSRPELGAGSNFPCSYSISQLSPPCLFLSVLKQIGEVAPSCFSTTGPPSANGVIAMCPHSS